MAAEATNQAPAPGWKRILRSLHHRNFRLFFIGQGISLIGTWMQQLAMGWLVYETTRRAAEGVTAAAARGVAEAAAKSEAAFNLGMVTFASQIPGFLLVPFVGVFLDRWNRHKVVITTQVLAMVQATILTALVYAGVITFWQIIALSVFMGCINAFDMPGRQAFLPEMLTTKDDLANAIALNSSLFNGARLIGPALAGYLIYLVGMAMCFLLNAVSYVAVIIALLAMQIPRRPRPAHRTRVLQGLREGYAYAFGFPPIRAIIFLVALMSFAGLPYVVLMPIFADEILKGKALALGLLMTASGLGALIGAVYMAARQSVLGLGPRIAGACLLFSVGLVGFSQSTHLGLSMALLVLTGLGAMVTMAGCNTILQTIVEEHMRGRVMSLYTMAFLGVSPFGSLLAGSLASSVGAPTTVLVSGFVCAAAALVFFSRLPAIRALVRPIYLQKGILTPEAPDIESVPEITLPPEDGAARAGTPSTELRA